MKLKIQEWLNKNLKWIILFVSIIAFLAIAQNVWNKEIMLIDIIGYRIVSSTLISDFITPISKLITSVGGT